MSIRDEVNRLRPYFYDRPSDPLGESTLNSQIRRSNLANDWADFEDSQASPYSFGGLSGFTLSLGSGATGNSTYYRHALAIHQNGSATPSYLQWTGSVSKKINLMIGLQNGAGTNDLVYEMRWWGVQSPGASDKYYALRFRYGSTGLQATTWYGSGTTFTIDNGFQGTAYWVDWPTARFMFIQLYSWSTPYGIADIWETENQVLYHQLAMNVAGYPTELKTFRLYFPASTWGATRIHRIYTS